MNSEFNPEMLILAREARGITQTWLAELTKIPQGNISMYESDSREIKPEHLTAIAEALDFPEDFFYREGRISAVETPAIFHRKRQSVPKSILAKLDATINLLRMDVERLVKAADIEFPLSIPKYQPDDFERDIEQIAALVRSVWDIPSGPVRHLVKYMEAAGCIILMMDFGTDKMDANVQWKEPVLPTILLSNRISGERQRFSLAHELGHLVMHRGREHYVEMEMEADQFAAAFLMSADRFCLEAPPVTIEHMIQIKSSWKVSVKALIKRALDLGLITDRRYTSLQQGLSRNGYNMVEPFPLPVEQPTLLDNLLQFYQSDLNLTTKDIADLLRIHEHDLKKRYMQNQKVLHLTSPRKRNDKKRIVN